MKTVQTRKSFQRIFNTFETFMLNVSVRNQCGVVVTSVLQNNQWMTIPCNQLHSSNRYFVCERHFDPVTKTGHHRALVNSQRCPRTFIYYFIANDLHCLTFDKSNHRNKNKFVPPFILDQWINVYLSKWSLRLTIHINLNSTSGLTTNQILHPDIRQWRVVKGTRSSQYGIIFSSQSEKRYSGRRHNHFLCEDFSFVLVQYRCDGKIDCKDKSDEKHCKTDWNDVCGNCSVSCELGYCKCPLMQFHCQSGGCISYNLVCDGVQDCDDDSDEMSCAQVSLP